MWTGLIEMAPDDVRHAVRLAAEGLVEDRLTALYKAEATAPGADPAALDVLMALAAESWLRWLREHPDIRPLPDEGHTAAEIDAEMPEGERAALAERARRRGRQTIEAHPPIEG